MADEQPVLQNALKPPTQPRRRFSPLKRRFAMDRLASAARGRDVPRPGRARRRRLCRRDRRANGFVGRAGGRGLIAVALWRRTGCAEQFAVLIAIGMSLGAIGDFFNAGLLSSVPLPDPVLGGIMAFGLGHIAYIAACLTAAARARLANRHVLLAAIAVWQLIGLVGWYFVAFQGTEARALIWPALPYSLLLAGTAGFASGLAAQDRRFAGLARRPALFLTSDLILAFELFRGPFAHQTECVWLTYGPGQMLIVNSTPAAAAVLRAARIF